MPSFIKSGSHYFAMDSECLMDTLPVGNYQVSYHPQKGYYLTHIDSFSLTGKIYGDIVKVSSRVLNTFQNRPNGTGVLFCGEKGSGKTLQAKHICIEAAKLGMPTIMVNSAYGGEAFNEFVQKINIPCILLFDEFEKTYNSTERDVDGDPVIGNDSQTSLLTLMDGSFPTKKLFILTSNSKYQINEFMLNRPGRIYYFVEFGHLLEEFIKEYCEDNLKDKKEVTSIIKIVSIFKSFNFDMLKSLVEEMNRYDESAFESIKMLNIRPDSDDSGNYTVELFCDNTSITANLFHGNPTKSPVHISYLDEKRNYQSVSFDIFKSFNSNSKEFLFEKAINGKNFVAKLKRKEEVFFADFRNVL